MVGNVQRISEAGEAHRGLTVFGSHPRRKQRLTRTSLQAAINEFSTEVKARFMTFAKDTNMNESKLKFLTQEVSVKRGKPSEISLCTWHSPGSGHQPLGRSSGAAACGKV